MEHPKDPQASEESMALTSDLDHARRLIEDMGSEKAHLQALLTEKDQELIACIETAAETVQKKEEECDDRLQELQSELHAMQMRLEDKDAELETAYEDAAEEVQRERENIAQLEEAHQSELESQRKRQQELEAELLEIKEKLNTADNLSRSAFEDGLAAGNRTQSDLQIEVEALTIQLEEEKTANHDVKAGIKQAAEKLQAEVEKSDALGKEKEQLLVELANSHSKYTAQVEEHEQRLSAEREMFESHLQAELSRQKEALGNSFAAEKSDIEARAEEACAAEVKKLLDVLQEEKDMSKGLEDELESLRRDKEETATAMETVRSELQASYSGIRGRDDTIEKLRTENNALQQEIEDFRARILSIESKTEDDIISAKQELDDLKDLMTKEREQLQAEISVLKTTQNEKTDELSQILGDKTALQDDLNATMNELEAVKTSTAKEREELGAEISKLKTTLDEKTCELAQMSDYKSSVQDHLNAARQELEAIKSSAIKESESSKVAQERLISSLDEANEALNEKSTENEALRVEINDLKNRLSSTKESSALQEDELRLAIANLEEVIRVRDQQYTELVGEKESLSEELVSSKSSNAISEEEVKSLKELLALRDEELAEESAEKQMVQQELDELKILAAEKKSRPTGGRTTAKVRTPIATTRQKSPATLGKAKGNGSMSKPEAGSSRSKASLYGTMSFKSRTAPVGDVAVMFCFKPTDAQKKMVTALGGTLIESLEKAHEATHVIAGDGQKNSLRRTPKLMISLCSTSNILHLDWLITSYKQKRFCESRQFLLLHDQTAESNYSFSMKETLRNGEERRSEGGLFTGRSIYFTKNVAGNKAPKAEELRMIINAAGGRVVDSLSPDEDYFPNVFVITSDPLLHPDLVAAQEAEEYVSEVADVFPTSWLFDVIIHQKLTGLKRGRGF
mmetsp:Transcript_12791/g.19361  ORF Transcript_12791/g.19361 Transcript_12791/m.19361 type:complete len:918 (+) Transcript_12791:121-2874(+)|eukprot:CAMPEP_0196818956 /NCGR_PEP_ID=MMETSP1362-20130617/68358_1 /TAXON_ID=163516 /ORGANISM="Leptocylindrus danicus, Strain CCMP1856" /LENGTH=917 /DNA_ID=CAMNT_0042197265 /DNA_START=47 /DNA_END=2800 /DNA_ORIENTATION=-